MAGNKAGSVETNRPARTSGGHGLGEAAPAHAWPVERIIGELDVDPAKGLSRREVTHRRRRHGENRLRAAKTRGLGEILWNQIRSVVIAILAGAALLAFISGRWPEGVAVVAVIVVNTVIGFLTEWRSVRSMEALQKLGMGQVRVRRHGREDSVSVDRLVVGDVVLLESGDVVPADLRLIEANRLRVDESALTGESVPASKTTEPAQEDAPLSERNCILYKGTTVVEGSAAAVAVNIGMATELGRISAMAEEAERERTPLEHKLNRLGTRLAWISVSLAVLIAGGGLLAGQPTLKMIETAIALGVAAIPEGLPFVATVALARGVWIMARRNALLRSLSSVETLGATRVLIVDKTGTLTENRMHVREVLTPGGTVKLSDDYAAKSNQQDPIVRRILEVGVLCNNASIADEPGRGQGDPTEVALLWGGRKLGLARDEMLARKPEEREIPFDPERMLMATFNQAEQGIEVAVKGAPEAVLEICDSQVGDSLGQSRPLDEDDRRRWAEQTRELASHGLRTLAMADKRVDDPQTDAYQGLRLLGVVGLMDPPRPGVADAVRRCQQAGIRIVMATGDRPDTALAIAREVGLVSDDETHVIESRELGDPREADEATRERIRNTNVFARVTPEQKLRLMELLQAGGDPVAMTGDGINDAPALKKADIGIAMGQRGTDAAREAADMVLRDDKIESIYAAVREGRIIFDNIRKSALFMLCTNGAEIVAVTVAAVLGAPLPLQALQILYLNVLTDVFPALALVGSRPVHDSADQPPRGPDEPILTTRHWITIAAWSLVIAGCVLAALSLALWAFGMDPALAVTASFLTLGFSKLWFVFNLRNPRAGFFRNEVVTNKWIWAALAFCAILLVLAVYLPGLSDVLRTQPPGLTGWTLLLALSLVPLLIGQLRFLLLDRRSRGHNRHGESAAPSSA